MQDMGRTCVYAVGLPMADCCLIEEVWHNSGPRGCWRPISDCRST